jgi:hypothetical protein
MSNVPGMAAGEPDVDDGSTRRKRRRRRRLLAGAALVVVGAVAVGGGVMTIDAQRSGTVPSWSKTAPYVANTQAVIEWFGSEPSISLDVVVPDAPADFLAGATLVVRIEHVTTGGRCATTYGTDRREMAWKDLSPATAKYPSPAVSVTWKYAPAGKICAGETYAIISRVYKGDQSTNVSPWVYVTAGAPNDPLFEPPGASNGCGGGPLAPLMNAVADWTLVHIPVVSLVIGDAWVHFRPACDQHDYAYDGIRAFDTFTGKYVDYAPMTRRQADDKFARDLRTSCDRQLRAKNAHEWLYGVCYDIADLYSSVVRIPPDATFYDPARVKYGVPPAR